MRVTVLRTCLPTGLNIYDTAGLSQHSLWVLVWSCRPYIALSAFVFAYILSFIDRCLSVRNGTQVLVTHLDPLKEIPKRGSVISCSDSRLEVIFPERFDLEVNEAWRIDVGRSNVAFERMEEAIRQLHHDPSTQETPEANTSDHEVMLQGTYLRDILLRSYLPSPDESAELSSDPTNNHAPSVLCPAEAENQQVDLRGLFQDDSRIMSWATRYSKPCPVIVEGDPALEGLNVTQIRAIAMMLNNRCSLVQGVYAEAFSCLTDLTSFMRSLQEQERRRRLSQQSDS